MEKNMILAIALSMAVLVGYSFLFPPAQPVKPAPAAKGQAAPSAPGVGAPAATPATASAQTPFAAAVAPVGLVPEKEIKVETDLYSAVVSTKGGVIKSWKLKKYSDAEGMPLELVMPGSGVKPLLLVPQGTSGADAMNLAYSADADNVEPRGTEPVRLTLTHAGADGRNIAKTLDFRNGTYAVDVSVKFPAGGYTLYAWDGLATAAADAAASPKGRSGFSGIMTVTDGSRNKDNPEKMEKDSAYSSAQGWTGMTDKYFLGALVPKGGIKAVVSKGTAGHGEAAVVSDSTESTYFLYAGPKEYDRLKALGSGLHLAVDYGWFAFIAKPLFVALKFFHGLVKNWGWAIIVLTFVVKALFAPLTHKMQKSMKRMQKLAPEMNELKEKHKVNPLGGCLPMFIQLPVFVALYNVLNNSIELRHAPFAFWLHDLAAKDPYYVLPILMGVSMLAMQKMTPTSMDPKQNMIMMFMPVIMTFLFISLPSGLVLYFTVSNLLSMAQQLYINKYSET